MSSLAAELLLLRKRAAFWVLLGLWWLMAILFSYILPYYAYTSDANFQGRGYGAILLNELLPQNLVANISGSFPFFGGTIALIMAAMAMGGEYRWGTLTPAFTQRDGRLKIFLAKILAIALALALLVLALFSLGFGASLLIAWREGQAIDLPPLWELMRALGANWLLMAAWAGLGVMLAAISRGTSLAIGLGMIYGLVLEGIISSYGQQIDLLAKASKGLLRTNGYSLISSLGVTIQGEVGPGQYSINSVSGTQAFIVLVIYIVLFISVTASLVRWRDVT